MEISRDSFAIILKFHKLAYNSLNVIDKFCGYKRTHELIAESPTRLQATWSKASFYFHLLSPVAGCR